jgi:hypothetical protein
VDVAQGVHDALERNASQRPAAKREIEVLAWDVELFCAVEGELYSAALPIGKRCAGSRDVLGARVEGVDEGGTLRCERGKAATSAANVDDAFAVERDEFGNRSRFDSGFVASVHPLRLRLVRLEGGAAGTELDCLRARVFEFRACVRIDELTRFDPLEAVPC